MTWRSMLQRSQTAVKKKNTPISSTKAVCLCLTYMYININYVTNIVVYIPRYKYNILIYDIRGHIVVRKINYMC